MENKNYKVTFSSRPKPLFPGYRPLYKISLILIILKVNSNGGKASLLKLHLFSWALKSLENLETLKELVTSNFQKRILYFGIEPSLNRALNLAVGEGLVSMEGDKYAITSKGDAFVKRVISDPELFTSEKPVLNLIGKKINESRISQLKTFWKNA